MEQRVYNFSAGPSMLPVPVLEQAQRDLVCYPGAGCSVLEMSHRSRSYESIIENAETDLRDLMSIPDDYAVLFLQGGASLQFSMVPMNLADQGATTAYAVTGQFAKKAWKEGQRWGNAVKVTDSSDKTFSYIPKITRAMLPDDARFLHVTLNNTIYGTSYNTLPQHGEIPLVADMSSIITGKEYPVTAFDLIYAGAQKNMGPAGLTVVILKKSLIREDLAEVIPTMLRYDIMAKNGSMYNTPPCFAIYVAGLVYRWLLDNGGIPAIQKINEKKAAMLYDAIDASSVFSAPAAREDRSIMNVAFTLPTEDDTKAFLAMATGRGMINLKGHRSVGGCRASIYNAMPVEGVEKLVQCIHDFEKGMRE